MTVADFAEIIPISARRDGGAAVGLVDPDSLMNRRVAAGWALGDDDAQKLKGLLRETPLSNAEVHQPRHNKYSLRPLMNPYRASFYQKQAEWHRYESPAEIRELHELRSRYYEWFTQDWLPADRTGPILDVGCGSGQFLYFLNKKQYTDVRGVDLDANQVEIAQALGLKAEAAPVIDYLDQSRGGYEMIAMLDIIEHFTREELFPLMEAVARNLRPGGRIIASVPNAESPSGLPCLYTDITHEIAFTRMSFEEMLFCHGLTVSKYRDPWPAPVGLSRRLYRGFVRGMRALEALRLRCLGFEPPLIWSNVMWVLAVKPEATR